MPRKMRPAPEDILLAKTTHGTWIACEEVWEDDQLVALRPMRRDPQGGMPGGIVQARERREILAEIERAVLNTRLRQAERRLNELERGPGPARGRYAATG